jgi:type I restriction enzyme, S subunit
VRLLRGTNIVPGGTRWDDVVFLPSVEANKYAEYDLADGDIVIAMDRPLISTGLKIARLAPADLPALLLQRVGRFRVNESTSPEYLYAFLNSHLFIAHIGGQATGTQLPHISATDVQTAPLPLPPLDQQRCIVKKIEALTAKSRQAKDALDTIPPLLERYRQSVLAAAFRGDLTKDWREQHPATMEPSNFASPDSALSTQPRRKKAARSKSTGEDAGPLPSTWRKVLLSDVAEIQLGQRRAPEYAQEAVYRYVRAANITWRGLDLSDLKTMGFAAPDALLLRSGDVLLTEASGSPTEVGKPAIWRDELENCCFQATVLRLRAIGDRVLPEWLYYSCLADASLGRFAAMAPGVGILHLTAGRMREWTIPLPPIHEQRLISRLLEKALRTVYAQQDGVGLMRKSLVRLDQAIMSAAFRGKFSLTL